MLRHPGQACVTRDPVFWKQPPDPKATAPFITPIRGNLRLVSVFICVNRVTRDPVPWGGKVRLPQRPEVSPKQATPLPLPNRLRQPFNYPR